MNKGSFILANHHPKKLLSLGLASLALTAPATRAQTTDHAAAPLPAAPAPQGNFAHRLIDFYRTDWHPAPTASTDPAPPRRAVPSPLNSPPFPSSDWSYGGSPTIGVPDGNSYPLQTAINGAKSRTKFYGWIEPTLNFSTSKSRNYPVTNDLYSNRLELGQVVLYVENLPDSVQQDHIDVGYHLTAFFGTDYRSTTDKGYLSQQLLDHNRQYGFDPVLEYVDIYFPHVASGMNLRVGRFISIPGIEAQLTPNNYAFSHSLLYSIDPFTDTGVLATIRINDRVTIQAGVSDSHDVALWTPDAKPAFMGCFDYTTKSVNDNFYLCANGINDGQYAFNNLQMYDATWYHKVNATVHLATEAYVMYQRNVPSVNGTIVPEKGTNGANCLPGEQVCLAPEWAIVNYVNKQLGPHDTLSLRSDYLNDKKGQRTTFATSYSEESIFLSHWIGTTVQIRPEIRFDHAWYLKSYDNGTHTNQFTFATDLILHF